MSDLIKDFEKATMDVQKLHEKPDNKTLLNLYALFKQSTIGDVTGEEPSGWDFVKKAKFDAWTELKGISKEDAKKKNISLVESLK